MAMTDTDASAGIREELDLTLFVPCLNEEKRVVPTLETVREAMAELGHSYEVIVVDDGSTDRTAEVVEEFCRSNPQMPVRLHRNDRNRGLSRSFVDTAFRGRGRYYRLVCGDNVEPKHSMIKILQQMGKADIIIPYYPSLPGKAARARRSPGSTPSSSTCSRGTASTTTTGAPSTAASRSCAGRPTTSASGFRPT